MNYEQKYKEALNKAKSKIENDKGHVLYEDDIMEIFPELAESEDEKIRKYLIDYVKSAGVGHSLFDSINTKENILLWLEKQGKQKSVNKVEPKAAIENGKWYVCDTPRYTDFEVGKAYYCLKNGMLKPNENEMARYVARHCFHLWTINDAKDGDVLSQDNIPFIFKRWDNNCIAYCGITDFGLFKIVEDDFSWCNSINVTPATKEQCNLLFQKMHDAGFEWNANTKQLIKKQS